LRRREKAIFEMAPPAAVSFDDDDDDLVTLVGAGKRRKEAFRLEEVILFVSSPPLSKGMPCGRTAEGAGRT